MKRALPIAIVLAGAACARTPQEPLALPPPATDTTLSVLEPNGAHACLWKRVEPGHETTLCRIDHPCDEVHVVFRASGDDAFAVPNGQPTTWLCPANADGAPPIAIPSRASAAGPAFDRSGAIAIFWDVNRQPSIRDRILARIRHEPLLVPTPEIRSAHLTAAGWQNDATLADMQGFDVTDDVVLSRGDRTMITPAEGRLARLVSESLPAAHPEIEWRSLGTSPGLAFLATEGDTFRGPLVFVLRGEDARLAPETPGEADEVTALVRGPLVLAERTGVLGPTDPHLWDASTGELLWADPNATRAVFWPKP